MPTDKLPELFGREGNEGFERVRPFCLDVADRVDAELATNNGIVDLPTITAYSYTLLLEGEYSEGLKAISYTNQLDDYARGVYALSEKNVGNVADLGSEDKALLALVLSINYYRIDNGHKYQLSHLKQNEEYYPGKDFRTGLQMEETYLDRIGGCLSSLGLDPNRTADYIAKADGQVPFSKWLVPGDIIGFVEDPSKFLKIAPAKQEEVAVGLVTQDTKDTFPSVHSPYRDAMRRAIDGYQIKEERGRDPNVFLRESRAVARVISKNADTETLRQTGICSDSKSIGRALGDIRKNGLVVNGLDLGGEGKKRLRDFRKAIVYVMDPSRLKLEEGENPAEIRSVFEEYLRVLDEVGAKKYSKVMI
ncbi:MAG: hypothetical protein WCV93_05890 [Candidatus Shapirobacteria bacterium]|jgi:hypothetical protein